MIGDQAETRYRTFWYRSIPGLALVLMLWACSAPSTGPEGEVREWLDRGVVATEAKDRSELLDIISPAYADSRGNKRAQIGNILRAYFMRMNKIELITTVNEITIMGETAAEVLLTVGMAGKKDGLLGFSADAYEFSLELEKSRGEWQLLSARWGELGKELR